jgi:hypothetical protein
VPRYRQHFAVCAAFAQALQRRYFRQQLRPETAMTSVLKSIEPCFEVRFASLFKEGRAMAFPCDASGHVELDALPSRARQNYLFARAMIGREYSFPRVFAPDAR